jgi:hypothetical protein
VERKLSFALTMPEGTSLERTTAVARRQARGSNCRKFAVFHEGDVRTFVTLTQFDMMSIV